MAMSPFDLWKFSIEEQAELLGTDIGDECTIIVIELDERSQYCFYNQRFAPLVIQEIGLNFQIQALSIDDRSLRMTWEVKKMSMHTFEARQKLDDWLKRTNYFVNLKGLEDFCNLFGGFDVDYN